MTKDLAVVFEGPCDYRWLQSTPFASRLAAVHFVMQVPKHRDKEYSIRDIRVGWERVRKELAPSVKRILLVADSSALAITATRWKKKPRDRFELKYIHGNIFTIDGIEMVPTFETVYKFRQSWWQSDLNRFANLAKPEKPLPYKWSISSMPDDCEHCVIDIETSGLNHDTDYITDLGIQWSDTDRAIIKDSRQIQRTLHKLTQLVREARLRITFHNGQFDIGFLGEELRDALLTQAAMHCTFIRSRATGELVGGLKHLATLYTTSPGNFAWHAPDKSHSYDDPAYLCEDLDSTWQLATHFNRYSRRPVIKQFEQTIIMAAEQTLVGSALDMQELKRLYEETTIQWAEHYAACEAEYGCGPNEKKKLNQLLLAAGYKLPKHKKTGNDTLDADALKELGLTTLAAFRKVDKLYGFVKNLVTNVRADGTISHHQQMLDAETGRTTMNNFNWQQAAKKGPIRYLLVSRFEGGQIGIVDLAQAELRVLAYYVDCDLFAELFELEDLHRANASRAFGVPYDDVTEDQRFDAKAVIFRIVFGGKPQNPGQEAVYNFFRQRFPKVFAWIESMRRMGKTQAEAMDAYGKMRNLLEVHEFKGPAAAGRAAINSPIQGTSSHIAMQVTFNLWWLLRKYKLRSLVIFGVHDSVVTDVHPDECAQVAMLTRIAFAMLRQTRMMKFRLAHTLPMLGEFMLGSSWGYIDEHKKTLEKTICSSLDPITEEDYVRAIF